MFLYEEHYVEDRLLAVVRHTEYQTSVHRHRVYCAIVFCWLFSLSIGLPLGKLYSSTHSSIFSHRSFANVKSSATGTGLNRGNENTFGDDYYCGIESAQYMLYGSVFAFFIPCAVIVTTYGCEASCR